MDIFCNIYFILTALNVNESFKIREDFKSKTFNGFLFQICDDIEKSEATLKSLQSSQLFVNHRAEKLRVGKSTFKMNTHAYSVLYNDLMLKLPWEGNVQLPKSINDSNINRIIGNESFKRSDFEAALEFYNASLCYAPAGSENIPLAYGNRSAVYCETGKYTLAIENIKLARESGFPAGKIARLNAREEKCKKLMEEHGPERDSVASSFFKLSHPPNAKIPFIADCLELRKNEKYGRHIVTTKDLKTGDIIALETPVFVWPNILVPGLFCMLCFESNDGSLIPCSDCASVMFCSEKCQKKSVLFHGKRKLFNAYNELFRPTLKMMLEAFHIAGGVDEAVELLKDAEGKTIFDFDFSNRDDPNYEKNKLIALNGLCKDIESGEIVAVDSEPLLNIPPINEKQRTSKERKKLLKFIISQLKICCSNMTLYKTDHHAISLLGCLLNHSCLPNVSCKKAYGKLVLFVVRPIRAGEQIFRAYGAHAAAQGKEQRDAILQKFPFKCDCEACANDYQLPFPTKDPRFVMSLPNELAPAEAIEQFKKNCKYIDENARKMPCFEVPVAMLHNDFLFHCIAGDKNLKAFGVWDHMSLLTQMLRDLQLDQAFF